MNTDKHTTNLRLGTRTSRLALWQTGAIADQLQAAWPGLRCSLIPITTEGDRRLDTPLPMIGGKGLFTYELERALLAGEIDLAVHSLKDLPTRLPAGLTLGAIVGRADVRDVLIAPSPFHALPAGARLGTSSRRRAAQLRALRPDLIPVSIRGNVDSRIRKVTAGEVDGIVLAAAGVTRLGLEAHISHWFSLAEMLPAPGQGALGVQCRADDTHVLTCLAALDNAAVRACVTAERTFLQALGGGCATPIGAYCIPSRADDTHVLTRLAALDNAAAPFRVFRRQSTNLHESTRNVYSVRLSSRRSRGSPFVFIRVIRGSPFRVFRGSPFPMRLTGLVAAEDGSRHIRLVGEDDDPERLGVQLAQAALAQGAEALLA